MKKKLGKAEFMAKALEELAVNNKLRIAAVASPAKKLKRVVKRKNCGYFEIVEKVSLYV